MDARRTMELALRNQAEHLDTLLASGQRLPDGGNGSINREKGIVGLGRLRTAVDSHQKLTAGGMVDQILYAVPGVSRMDEILVQRLGGT